MKSKILTILAIFLFTGINTAIIQAQDAPKIELDEVEMPKKLLPYTNPMFPSDYGVAASDEPIQKRSDDFQKEIIAHITDIYRIHVNAMNAQINNDLVGAEEYITDALTAIQSLLDDYPEVQSDRRFHELYRTVMTEYREFYGIEEPAMQVEGEVFAIRKELYSGEDDWMETNYVLPENITDVETEVPLIQNRYVNRHLMYYTMNRPDVMEAWLKRKERYFPMMKRIFKEEGTPVELIHLSMIESGLNPTARSWASAVGMWQFIRATGSMYGLDVNFWVDERRDPEKSTRAAARHLGDLYGVWGDWHLAMAGYNISPHGLKRAIRAGGGERDYWSAYNHLPRETRGYIPGFIAVTMIEMNPEAFGFKEDYDIEPYKYEVAEVGPLMPLEELAKAAGITLDKLKEYNPELLRWATPPGSTYPLKLPVDTKEQFLANYDDIPKESINQNVAMHTVHRGETLGYIARKYGTTVRSLYETNENLSHIIYPGQKIVVPLAPGSTGQIAVNRSVNSSSRSSSRSSAPANSVKIRYEVKRGDTIGHIAEWYDVRAWQIRAWNNTSNYILPGEHLTVYVPEGKEAYYRQVDGMSFSQKHEIEIEQRAGKDVTEAFMASAGDSGTIQYTVQRNDTLIDIARSFGVTVSDIKRLNGLSGSRIYVGQILTIQN